MQVSFSLRKDKINKDGLIPIRMLISFKGQRIRRDIKGVKTLEKDWKTKEQRIKAPTKKEPYNYYIEYNINNSVDGFIEYIDDFGTSNLIPVYIP